MVDGGLLTRARLPLLTSMAKDFSIFGVRHSFCGSRELVGFPFTLVPKCGSLAALGVWIVGCGVEGRFVHPAASTHELGSLCGSATTVSGIAVPF